MKTQITKACAGKLATILTSSFLLLVTALPTARGQGYVYNQQQIPGLEGLAVADFNGDGISDIVTLMNPNGFGVCLGKKAGTFAAPLIVDATYQPSALVVGDFNGDGKPDLATLYLFGGASLKVYLGNGDGTFQTPATYATGAGPNAMVTADFNGDQKPDIAVLNQSDSTVSVYFGNGDGTFQAQSVQSVAASSSLILTADLNNDSRADIVTLYNGTSAMTVLLAGANGTFTRSDTTLSAQGLANAAAIGDLNGDNIPDLVIPSYSANPSGFSLLIGNGDGTFQSPVFVTIPYIYNCSTAAVGDFNHDGMMDVAVVGSGASNAEVAVVLGHGNGTFTAGTTSYAAYGIPLLFADFNGDSVPDLLAGSMVELGAGDGTFANSTTTTVPQTLAGPALSGDFNGDGKLDVTYPAFIAANTYQMVTVLGNGNGSFPAPTLSPATSSNLANGTPPGLTADLNGDGKLDVVIPSPYQVAATLGNGDGTFQAVVNTLLPAGLYFQAATAGDFNHDGKADLAVTAFDPQSHAVLQILLSNGDGTFTVGNQYALGYALIAAITSADFDGDGKVDLAISLKNESTVNIFLGNGDGTFRQGTALTSISAPEGVSAGDVNKDGIPDLIVQSLNSDQTCGLSVLYGNGNGTFQAPIVTTFGSFGNCPTMPIEIGDINGDGKPDLITNIALTVFLGHGDGTFSPELFLTIGAPAINTFVGDINGDGATDLGVLYSVSSGTALSFLVSSPAFGAYPSRLSFESTDINMSSTPLAINLVNHGSTPMNISSITASGEYSQTNGCGASLAAQASCEINVAFSPASIGTEKGSITIVDNAAASPQILSLTGVGVVPVAGAAPGTLTFAKQLVGTPSTAQVVTLSNTGSGPLFMAGISFTGTNGADFAETDNCGSAVAAGSSCAINVTFAPTAVGTRGATVTLTDNNNGASGSTQTITLNGTGIAPVVALNPASLPAFADEQVGNASAAQTITLSNTGSATLSIASIVIAGADPGDFAETSTCGTSVATSASCMISVTFKPAAIGSRSATLKLTDNNNGVANSAQTFNLAGTGTGAAVTLAPGTVPFGPENVGSSSPATGITLTNTGNSNLAISAIAVTGAAAADFAIQAGSTCSTTAPVTAGKSCTISLVFTPSAEGTRSANLTITDNAVAGSSQTVSLSGSGKGFSLAVSSPKTISAGQSATFTLTVTPQDSFAETASVTCSEPSGLTESTCTPSAPSVTLNGSSPSTVTITVSTTVPSLIPLKRRTLPSSPPKGPFATRAIWLALCGLLGALILASKMSPGRRFRNWREGLVFAILLLLFVLLASCGGGGGAGGGGGQHDPGTAKGTYSLTVSVVGGNITETSTLGLTVN